jgi:acetyltransferase-like isoleucine patch superfamily enzyme
MIVSRIRSRAFSELNSLYAFWVLRLLDCLGHSPVANRARGYLLSLLGFDIGAGCVIRPKLQIQRINSSLKIGSKTKINYDVFFEASAQVAIGDSCQVGHGVRFGSVDYDQLPLGLKLHHSAPPPPENKYNRRRLRVDCL